METLDGTYIEPVNSWRGNGIVQFDASARGSNGVALRILHLGDEYTKRDGTKGQDKVYMNIIMWGEQSADFLDIEAGDIVGVEGGVQFNTYETSGGVRKEDKQIVARDIVRLGKGAAPERQERQPAQQTTADAPADDDIPF